MIIQALSKKATKNLVDFSPKIYYNIPMVITYYGLSCFKVSSGEFVLAFDPPSKKSSFKSPRFRADAVLISRDHDDHNGYDEISGKDSNPPLKIDGPGEYEIQGVNISGISANHDSSAIYTVDLEGIRLCHLGGFEEKELSAQALETIGRTDVLFLPIGGKKGVLPEAAAKIANQLEPKIIVPMHYEKKDLGAFLKEFGVDDLKAEEKLTLKRKDMSDAKTDIRVLKPSIQ